jgi:hypothetical protein
MFEMEEGYLMDKQPAQPVIIKHSAAIQIQNNITLLQRKAWNVLLFHAYDDLPYYELYSIPIKDLKTYLNYNSHDDEYLKQTVRALVNCAVEWNILDKDGKQEWGIAALLAQVTIKDGICSYAYAPVMRERLHNPSMYARISLSLQNVFDSKYGQTLWELCVDYLGHEREYGETPFISIEQLHKLMGVENSKYVTAFKIFNRDVIKPAMAEINQVSDLRVEAQHKRQGRRVLALKFKMRREVLLPSQAKQQGALFPDLDDMPPLVQALKAAGLASADAWRIWQQGTAVVEAADKPAPEVFEAYIYEKLDLLERRQRAGKVESATGFLLAAIKHNYPNPEYQQRGKRRRAQQAQAQDEQQAELERRFEAHREQVFWQRFGERPGAWQAEQRGRLEAVLKSAPEHRFAWQSYREHGSLKAPSVAGVLMAMLESELLSQPEETSLEGFVAWEA